MPAHTTIITTELGDTKNMFSRLQDGAIWAKCRNVAYLECLLKSIKYSSTVVSIINDLI